MAIRRRKPPIVLSLGILAALALAAALVLMFIDVPAPQKPVEKTLDAKSFE